MLSTILLFLGGLVTAYFTYRAAVEVARINAEAYYRKTVEVAGIQSAAQVEVARLATAGAVLVPEKLWKRRISSLGTAGEASGRDLAD